MQITSPDLKITHVFTEIRPTTEKHFVSNRRHKELLQIDIFNLQKTKNEIVTFLGNRILDVDTMPQMIEIVVEFAEYIIQLTKNNIQNQKLLMLNSRMIKIQTLKWLDEAHKSVYGVEIPNLVQYIRNEQKEIMLTRRNNS